MQQLTIRMPDDYFIRIQQIAEASGLKKSDVTRMALKMLLKPCRYGRHFIKKMTHFSSFQSWKN